MTHQLQRQFATAEGEQQFNERLRAMFEAGDLDGADALLSAEIETMESDIAAMCRRMPRESVVLSGWEDVAEAIAYHEGDPVTGVTLAIGNEQDLAFEKGELHEPFVMMGLYTDEAYPFSSASAAELIGECQSEDGPAWAGMDEDVELYLEVEGLGRLNTALIFHKQRHFFRDDNLAEAPMRYVDYVVGCWWRALRFQQAVAAEYQLHGLPGGIPVVAGMVDLRPEVLCVHKSGAPATPVERRAEAPEMAEIRAADFIQRKPFEEEKELTGSDLRKRFAAAEPAPAATAQPAAEPATEPASPRSGLIGRLFGR